MRVKALSGMAPARLLAIACVASCASITLIGTTASAAASLAVVSRHGHASQGLRSGHASTSSGGWSTQPIAVPLVPNGELAAVSCTSVKACEAVGSTINSTSSQASRGTPVTLAESWNGTAWTAHPAPNPAGSLDAGLQAVSCAASSSCQSVGSYLTGSFATFPYAQAWNGKAWSLESLPSAVTGDTFAAVSCPLSTDCEAVGTGIMKWSGKTWVAQAAVVPSGASSLNFTAVSCKAANACEAVGSYFNASFSQFLLVESWNGTAWKLQSIAAPGGSSSPDLYGVSCTTAATCEAVGGYLNKSNARVAFSAKWNGTAWAVQAVASPAGATSPFFQGVSCTAATACEAVGTYTNASKVEVPWAEAWNGSAWALQSAPAPAGAPSPDLYGVSCGAKAACEAVGQYVTKAELSVSFGDVLSGGSWKAQATANPGASWGSQVSGLSCGSTSACEAVGSYLTSPDASPTSAAFAAGWNGSAWTDQTLPTASVVLSGVSCPSPDSCEAVGSVAVSWNGKAWTAQTLAKPPGAKSQSLQAVSCPVVGHCEAVGDLVTSADVKETLAEMWNGAAWGLQTTPGPTGATAASLAGVSCASASACVAVGKDTASSGHVVTLAEDWKGSVWDLQVTPDAASSNSDELSAVACPAASSCETVGNYTPTNSTATQPLVELLTGTTWSLEPVPVPAGDSGSTLALSGVSCLSTKDCEAVGTMTYVWNGTAWEIQSGSTIGLAAVSCPASDNCEAVGASSSASTIAKALAEGWRGPSWSDQVSADPDSTAVTGDGLSGVSCVSSSSCEAVGGTVTGAGRSALSAESWNGSTWEPQTIPTPSDALFITSAAVSCSAPTSCEAVGEDNSTSGSLGSFAAGWNGSKWVLQTIGALTSPSSAPLLYAVSCTASSCEAVGSYTFDGFESAPLAEVWNGTTWTAQTTPFVPDASNTAFSSVACTASTSCEAVGYYTDESGGLVFLADVWNGTTWTIQTSPTSIATTGFNPMDVSCSSVKACQAVGYENATTGDPIGVGWNGTSWQAHAVSVPKGATQTVLSAVSCAAGSSCEAVGEYRSSGGTQLALAEQWNGSSWSMQATPSPSSYLKSVSCLASPSDCEAVGIENRAGGVAVALAEVWNGTTWSIQASASPPTASNISLAGVSCTAVNACEAVGGYTDSLSGPLALAEGWNGDAWNVQPVPTPTGGSAPAYTSVSCTSPASCEAVGSYLNASATRVALAEVWNGTTWKVQATPALAGDTAISLSSVSCVTASGCEAVGSLLDAKKVEDALAEVWNGTAWKAQAVIGPIGAAGASLSGVSCVAAMACEAVGDSLNASKVASSLSEVWNGKTWKPLTVPAATGAKSSSLTSVSCSASSACEAVGSFTNATKVRLPLAEVLSGAVWKAQAVPVPAGATASSLSGVSCQTGSCQAVGATTTSTGGASLVILWDGKSWALQTAPAPSGAERAGLEGVACTGVQNCSAAGSSTSTSRGQVALVEVEN